MNNSNIMIDLETLGTDDDAVVLSIGAVFFDPRAGLGNTYERAIKIQKQIDMGRTITGDTFLWWIRQKDDARNDLSEKMNIALEIEEVMVEFANFVADNGPGPRKLKPWGNGSTFDVTMIQSLMNSVKVKVPWVFYNIRDLRTFREYVANNEKVEASGIKHSALGDAISQATFVINHTKKIRALSR